MPLSDDLVLLISELEFSLPYFRRDLEMALVIGTYKAKRESKNALLNYALDRASSEPVERIVLVIADALDPALENACQSLLKRSLFSGRGRQRKPADPALALLMRFRSQFLAHPVRFGPNRGGSLKAVLEQHKNTYELLLPILDYLHALIRELAAAGLYAKYPTRTFAHERVPSFSEADLARLVAAANAIDPLPQDNDLAQTGSPSERRPAL